MARKRNLKPARVVLQGDTAHNTAFYAAIGQLVVAWANNESVFLAMLQLLTGDSRTALIMWHSLRTTQARLDLIGNLSREKLQGSALLVDVAAAIKRFKGFTGLRNFYCHAQYDYDLETLIMVSASQSTLSQEDSPIRHETRPLDKSAMNSLSDTSTELAEYNKTLWVLVGQLSVELGLQLQGQPGLQTEQELKKDKPAHQGKGPLQP